MQYFRAVIRELRRLAHVQPRHQARVRHYLRVGSEHTGHVLPECHRVSVERTGKQRRGEIRPTPPECDDRAVRRRPDVAREDGHDVLSDQRQQVLVDGAHRAHEIRRGVAVTRICVNDPRRVDDLRVHAKRRQRSSKHRRRHTLANSCYGVSECRMRRAPAADLPHELRELVEPAIDHLGRRELSEVGRKLGVRH